MYYFTIRRWRTCSRGSALAAGAGATLDGSERPISELYVRTWLVCRSSGLALLPAPGSEAYVGCIAAAPPAPTAGRRSAPCSPEPPRSGASLPTRTDDTCERQHCLSSGQLEILTIRDAPNVGTRVAVSATLVHKRGARRRWPVSGRVGPRSSCPSGRRGTREHSSPRRTRDARRAAAAGCSAA